MRYADRIELLRTKHRKYINQQLICNMISKQLTREYYERHQRVFNGLTEACMNTGSKERRRNQYFNSVGFRKNWEGVSIFIDKYINKEMIGLYGGQVNVAVVSEPECIVEDTNRRVIENIDNIDLVLTNKDYLLKKIPEKTAWIPTAIPTIGSAYCGVGDKNKICSHIISRKLIGPGHKLRYEIAKDLQKKKSRKIMLHGSGVKNGMRDEKGEFLKDYLFSLAIENEKQDNYYTEKILDCFATGTVPIYWGGKITKSHFEEKGIIYFNDIDELNEIMENIYRDPVKEYMKRIEYICENKRIVEKYERIDDIIMLEIIEFMSKQREDKYEISKVILGLY